MVSGLGRFGCCCTTPGSMCAPTKSYLDVLSVLKVEMVAKPSPKVGYGGGP